MRKYFLLGVAMLVATNVNATTDYAEVTAKATIEVANTITCSDIDWTTTVIKQNNKAFTIDSTYPDVVPTDVISSDYGYISNYGTLVCEGIGANATANIPSSITLRAENGNTPLTVRPFSGAVVDEDGRFYAPTYLDVPEKVTAGNYEAKFTVTFTY